jgi:hypothetical protein
MADRSASIGSAVTEAESYDDNEKHTMTSNDGSFVKLKSPGDMEMGSESERADLLSGAPPKAPEPESSGARAAIIWMVVNTLSTIGIVRLTNQIYNSINWLLTSVYRSSRIRLSSPTHPSNSPNLRSPLSISSLHGSLFSRSLDLDLQCLYPDGLQLRRSFLWQLQWP